MAKRGRPSKPKLSLDDLLQELLKRKADKTGYELDDSSSTYKKALFKDLHFYLSNSPDAFWTALHLKQEKSEDYDLVGAWETVGSARCRQGRPAYRGLPWEVLHAIVDHDRRWLSQPLIDDQIKDAQDLILGRGQDSHTAYLRKQLKRIDPGLVPKQGAGNEAVDQKAINEDYERTYALLAVINDLLDGSPNPRVRLLGIADTLLGEHPNHEDYKEFNELVRWLVGQGWWTPGQSPRQMALKWLAARLGVSQKTIVGIITRERKDLGDREERIEELYAAWAMKYGLDFYLNKNKSV